MYLGDLGSSSLFLKADMAYFLTNSYTQSRRIRLDMDFVLKSWADRENSMS